MDLQRKHAVMRPVRRRWTAHQQREVERAPQDRNWPGTLMVAGILFFVASFWGTVPRTLIGYGELFRWFALFAFLGNLVPYARSGLRLGMERLEWFLFNLLAVGPLVTGTLLWVNFTLKGAEQLYLVPGMPEDHVRTHWLHHGELPLERPFRTGEFEPEPGDFVLGLSPGGLGYPVVRRWGPAGVVMGE